MSGRSIGIIMIIILSFWVSKSKNKNIDHRVKETCATVSTQVNPDLFTRNSKCQVH